MSEIERAKLAKLAGISIATLMVLSTLGLAATLLVPASAVDESPAAAPYHPPELRGSTSPSAAAEPAGTVPAAAHEATDRATADAAPASGSARPVVPNAADGPVPGVGSPVGDGNDWYADAPSGDLIGVVTGTFPAETGVTGELSANGPGGGPACPVGTENCYGLQINTNQFPTTYESSGGPISTSGSEQFVYQDAGTSAFMGIWVILFGFSTCPSPSPSGFSAWGLTGGNCYAHTPFVPVPPVPVTNLSEVTMTAYANQSGSDALVFCVSPAVSGWPVCTPTSGSDAIGLADAWTVAEFNVFGDNGGSQAAFNGGAALQVQTEIASEGGGSLLPTCASAPSVHTVEDNNLYLWPCSASPSGILFWEANESYGLSALPASATVQAGQTATYSVGFTAFSGVAAPVLLTLTSPLPSGVTSSFPVTVTPPSTGALTLGTSPTTPLGDYTLTVQAEIASLVGNPNPGPIATTTISLHVYNFTVSISPASQTVVRGLAATYAIQLGLDPGSTLVGVPAIVLTDPGLPGDASASGLNPAGYVLSSPAVTTVSFVVSTAPAPTGSLGNFPFVITATPQGYPAGAASVEAVLHIFDFSVALAPTAETLAQGASTTLTVTVGLVTGSTTVGLPPVALSLSGTPSGVVVTGFPSSLAIGSAQSFTLSTGGAGSYVSCPQVSDHGGQYLRGADLAHCDLAGYDLAWANLVGANLQDADLAGASLVASDLAGANLAGAATVGTNFAAANLAGADLSGAGALGTFVLTASGTAQGVTRSGTSTLTVLGDQLSGDDFELANLWTANLAQDVATGTNFQWANLGAANLTGVGAGSADFFAASLAGADLAGSQLSGADFELATLAWADLAGSQAANANFQLADLAWADLAGAQDAGASFRLANLLAADLAGGGFTGASFEYADLFQADLAGGTFVDANFEYANLGGSNLSLGNFDGANFTGAFTKGAVLTGATFVGAIDPP